MVLIPSYMLDGLQIFHLRIQGRTLFPGAGSTTLRDMSFLLCKTLMKEEQELPKYFGSGAIRKPILITFTYERFSCETGNTDITVALFQDNRKFSIWSKRSLFDIEHTS